jgi:hypothetical protein
MSRAKALKQLGFESLVDFRLYDNSDGNGQQMEWLSNQPQPSDAEIAVGQEAWDAEQVSVVETKASAVGKLNALGLNDAEIASITGV